MPTETWSDSLFSERALQKCRSYVVAQLEERKGSPADRGHVPGPAITVSREAGCGTPEVLECLARVLQQAGPNGPALWTVFDRQLMERILEEHNLPKELAPYIPEERRSYLQDMTEELVGLRPPSWKIVPETIETILHLVEIGHVIIVGRGCNVITARTPNVFHVRLIAPLAQRIDYVRQASHLTEKEATARVMKEDRGRVRYLKSHFKRRIDDPLLYHAIINTGRMSYADAALLIADGARRHFQHEAEKQTEVRPPKSA
jgi:hypothetical protein